MTAINNIARIQHLLEGWRTLGSCTLPNGIEFIGQMPERDDAWMHCVFPRNDQATIDMIGAQLGVEVPPGLRAFYRCCGGLTLFSGAFCLLGGRRLGLLRGDQAYQPEDIVAFNHELDIFGWRPKNAVAFARNAWDASVHVIGMGNDESEVVRCEQQTGHVLERHANVFECVAARLYRLDQLMLA